MSFRLTVSVPTDQVFAFANQAERVAGTKPAVLLYSKEEMDGQIEYHLDTHDDVRRLKVLLRRIGKARQIPLKFRVHEYRYYMGSGDEAA